MKLALVITVIVIGLLAAAIWVYFNTEQLGLLLPSKDELVHLADVAAGELGDKSVPKWKEFLARSAKFAEENPDLLEIWILRASGALVVDDQQAGQEASEHLAILHKPGDPVLDKLIQLLWAKGWFSTRNLDYALTVLTTNQLVKQTSAVSSYLSLDSNHDSPKMECEEEKPYHTVILDFSRLRTITAQSGEDHVTYSCQLLGSDGFVEYPHNGSDSKYDHYVIYLKSRRAADLAAALFTHLRELLINPTSSKRESLQQNSGLLRF